jgi:hypothetical protein
MTWTLAEAIAAFERQDERMRRIKSYERRCATMMQRYGANAIAGYNSVSQIPMHVTEWWTDEFGNLTRQIWAK